MSMEIIWGECPRIARNNITRQLKFRRLERITRSCPQSTISPSHFRPPGEHFCGNQKSCLMETMVNPLESPGWDQPSNQRNIILLGKSGIGKSSVGNILLDGKVFQTSLHEEKGTQGCEIELKDDLTVVDTPEYFSSLRSDTDTAQDIVKTLQLNKLSIHVFMFVLSADPRFSGDEKESFDFIKRLFGENVEHNMIIVFTGNDQLEDFDIKFKEPDCLPPGRQFLINGKILNAEVGREILTEIGKSRYEKAVDVPNIDKNTLSTIETTENERKMGSKRRAEELSNTYQSHLNQDFKRRADELSPTPYPPNENSNSAQSAFPKTSQHIGGPSTGRTNEHLPCENSNPASSNSSQKKDKEGVCDSCTLL